MALIRSFFGSFAKALPVGFVFALVLFGCAAADNDGAGDAPITRVEDTGWVVMNAVDRYPNIAFRCYGPNGIYATRNADNTAARTFQVVPADPNCAR